MVVVLVVGVVVVVVEVVVVVVVVVMLCGSGFRVSRFRVWDWGSRPTHRPTDRSEHDPSDRPTDRTGPTN